MSFIKSKHSGWSWDLKRTPFMGGGGGGPSQTTTQTSNIPEYARPYVENMLGATQAQLFNTQTNPDTGAKEISGFKPYQAYSSNVNDYFAGPSPLQLQSYQAASQLQTPQQIMEGSQLAARGGQGLLGTAAPALGLSAMASGAGQAYENQATNPNDVSRYMSPYMQNVVDYQKSQALRDFQMGQPMMQARAAGQGAFGGNRLALQQAEAQRGLMSQLQGIEATGAQSAFDKAQAAQQYRANLGLQGMQAGLQGLGTAQQGLSGGVGAGSALGGLGTQQLGAQTGIIGLQNQLGTQQQQMEQAKINQAISDYATTQQYPMLQLGMMSNMLRGLPMQSQTTQMYQAQPSTLQQGIGTIGALGSLYGAGAMGRKEGGIIGYKYGGAIPGPKLEGMADKLDIPQLVERLKDPQLDEGERQVFKDALNDKSKEKARYAGIAAAGGGLFESQGYAGGGILAFANEGEVKDPDEKEKKKNSAFQQDLVDMFGYSGTKDARPEVPEWITKTKDYFTKPRESTVPTPAQLDALAASKGVYPEGSPSLPDGTNIPAGPTQAQRDAFYEKGAAGSQGARAPGSGASGAQPNNLAALLKERQGLGPQGVAGADFEEFLKGRLGDSSKRLSQAQGLAAAKAFAEFGTTAAPGGIGQAISRGLGTYAGEYGKATSAEDAITLEAQKMQKDLDVARRAEARGDVEGAQKAYDSAANRKAQIEVAQIHAAATMAGHGATQKSQDAAIDKIMKEKNVGYTEALQIYKRAGLNVENTDIARAKAALTAINDQLMGMKRDDPARAGLMAQRDQLTNALVAGGGTQVGAIPKDIQGILSKYQ